MSIVVLAGVLLLASTGVSQDSPLHLTEQQIQSFDPVGSCERNGRSIDMHRLMFLENRSVDIDGPDGPLRVSIEGDGFHVDEIGGNSQHRQFNTNISEEVDPGGGLDIELKLAYFEGRLVLYWKETFQNRHYRQGLFNIAGPEVTLLCSGQGGSHIIR